MEVASYNKNQMCAVIEAWMLSTMHAKGVVWNTLFEDDRDVWLKRKQIKATDRDMVWVTQSEDVW